MLTDGQVLFRTRGIGASEVAILFDADPYRSKYDLFLKKLGLVEDEETIHTRRGRFLEDGIREWTSSELGIQFIRVLETRALDGHPHVLATPDGESSDGILLEIKAPARVKEEWRSENPPRRYWLQVQQQLLVWGAQRAYLSALLDGELKIYPIEFDPEIAKEIVDRIERFWTDFIETRTPPPLDGSPSANLFLEKKFPKPTSQEFREASEEERVLVEELRELDIELERLEKKRERIAQEIKLAIGESCGLAAVGLGRISWSSAKMPDRVDWDRLIKDLRIAEETIAQYRTAGKTVRRFRATWEK